VVSVHAVVPTKLLIVMLTAPDPVTRLSHTE
jgi:hypothetical protein